MTLVSTVGGAAGPLYGTLLPARWARRPRQRTTLTTAEWAGVVSAGVAGVQMRGKAEPGDKTMVDALLPAAEALRTAAGSGATLPAACRAAADAAAEGMRRDDAAGRAQGPRQLPGRAQRRAPGPGRDVVVAAAGDRGEVFGGAALRRRGDAAAGGDAGVDG